MKKQEKDWHIWVLICFSFNPLLFHSFQVTIMVGRRVHGSMKGRESMEQSHAVLTNSGGYTKFIFKGKTITFMHGKDLLKYLRVKEWEDGYLVVDCLGKVKGKYEDYIDLPYILEKLYMDPKTYLHGMQGVTIQYA